MNSGLALIGCGNLGSSIAQAVLGSNLVGPENFIVIEREAHKTHLLSQQWPGVVVQTKVSSQLSPQQIIIVAVKPQDALPVLQELAGFYGPSQLVISVMAGISVAAIRHYLGQNALVIRCMPNLASKIGKGVTGYYSPAEISAPLVQQAERIFRSFGVALRVNEERLIDAITALSASGPAYFFYVIEHFMAAARELGFSEQHSKELALGTMAGSLELMKSEAASPAQLREAVTSAGGTTAAALRAFEEGKMGQVLEQGISAAYQRAIELSK